MESVTYRFALDHVMVNRNLVLQRTEHAFLRCTGRHEGTKHSCSAGSSCSVSVGCGQASAWQCRQHLCTCTVGGLLEVLTTAQFSFTISTLSVLSSQMCLSQHAAAQS
jgi:hypothetical protein